VVIHSAETEMMRLANLLKPTKTMEWTVDKNEQYCRKNHNACFLTLLIGPTMLCCLAKILPRGKPSRLTMAQFQVFSLDST